MGTRRDFALAVLTDPRVARPTSDANVDAMLAWMRSEFGASSPSPAAYNPFATTTAKPNATAYNSFGDPTNPLHVWSYPDWATGVEATVDTLVNGYYQPILDALTNAHDAQAVVDAVHASPWGSKPTADMLAEVYTDPAGNADLEVGPDAVPVPAPVPAPVVGRVEMPAVAQGATGDAVVDVQRLVGVTPDGQFGPVTDAAVRAYQSTVGITVDGVVGPVTWTTLVQRAVGVTVDGQFGPVTTAAVEAWQSAHGLTVDGIAGPVTFASLVG
jgi:peptidoglycan hydrolase-like protein with peptidoglycan-binding domain